MRGVDAISGAIPTTMRKRWLVAGLGFTLVAAGCLVACASRPEQLSAAPPVAPELVSQLRADVHALAGDIGPRAVFRDDSLARAERWVTERFVAQGWTVVRQMYVVSGVECANLIVERRGTTKPDEIIVIGAHYDSVSTTPGADDNASGVAALLALAAPHAPRTPTSRAALLGLPAAPSPERTLRFVAFTNEEPIYFQTEWMGSRVYAKSCKANGDKVVAMCSLETIGYYRDAKGSQEYPFPLSLFYPSRGNFLAVVGNRDSQPLVKRVTTILRQANTIPVEAAALPSSLPGVGWSDHWSFWQEGYRAVMFTDTAPFRNPNYHRATDTTETLDYERLAAAVQGIAVVVDELGRAEK